MVLSLIEYCDIVYAGTSCTNLQDIDKLFYQGLRICVNSHNKIPLDTLCIDCKIALLEKRRLAHFIDLYA